MTLKTKTLDLHRISTQAVENNHTLWITGIGGPSLALLTTMPLRDPEPVRVLLIGDPKAQERPRLSHRGTHRTARAKANQEAVALAIKAASRWTKPRADLNFGARMLFDCPTNQRKDLDNMVKLVLDAATGILWADDQQVTELAARARRGMGEHMGQSVLYFYSVGERS